MCSLTSFFSWLLSIFKINYVIMPTWKFISTSPRFSNASTEHIAVPFLHLPRKLQNQNKTDVGKPWIGNITLRSWYIRWWLWKNLAFLLWWIWHTRVGKFLRLNMWGWHRWAAFTKNITVGIRSFENGPTDKKEISWANGSEINMHES